MHQTSLTKRTEDLFFFRSVREGRTPTDAEPTGACELVAIPLCHAGWEGVVSGEHLTRSIAALAVGLPLGLVGASFHWWKDYLPSARDWLTKQANRWWPAAAVVALVYFLAPVIYLRTVESLGAPSPIGNVVWNFENSARGGAFFLGMIKTENQEIRVLGFQAHGRNTSSDPIHEFSGDIRSNLTNITKPIYISPQQPAIATPKISGLLRLL
jgi:hypothetical protein